MYKQIFTINFFYNHININMNLNNILTVTIIFAAYTLYHTYFDDYGTFLLIILLMLSVFYVYQYLMTYVDFVNQKMNYYENIISDKINNNIINNNAISKYI